MMDLGTTAGVLKDANIGAAKASASIIAGDIIAGNIVKFVKPKVPMYARGYLEQPLGKAVLSNAVAGALISTMSDNKQAMMVADALIASASLEVGKSFNIEEMFNELLAGVNIDSLTEVATPSE